MLYFFPSKFLNLSQRLHSFFFPLEIIRNHLRIKTTLKNHVLFNHFYNRTIERLAFFYFTRIHNCIAPYKYIIETFRFQRLIAINSTI
jgi:hypothetical protein